MNRATTIILLLTTALVSGALAADPAAAPASESATTAAAPAPARRTTTVVRKRAAAPVKVTATQLWMRLDTIEGRLEAMQKSMEGIGTASTAAAAAAAAARPTVQMPGPGEGAQAREMAGAFYNYGVYQRRAANTRLAANLIRDITVLAGTIVAFHGWEDGRQKDAPRTIGLAYKEYRGFTIGVSTAVIGVIVSEIVKISANRAEAAAAKALMRPLEEEPPSGAAPAVEVK